MDHEQTAINLPAEPKEQLQRKTDGVSHSAMLVYQEGYRKALMDLHEALSKWEPAFRSDRKRNNVKNVIWLLDGILEAPDIFAEFIDETPVYFEDAGKKRLVYFINRDEWPVSQYRAGSSEHQ